MNTYPKRLIEIDLPIRRISEHARREKSIRHGHISTLHVWWARRPLAACRAVICAALWPDPADSYCADSFRKSARALMKKWATENIGLLSEESYKRFIGYRKNPDKLNDNEELRSALFDFIADFSNWDNSTKKEYLDTSRILTQTAHEALGGTPGTRPLIVDPFAGGGSIPLEALRVGADAFASDLNPVAVLLNKVLLEYIPMYGQNLSGEVRKWGEWVKKEVEKELAEFYPTDSDGATPIAYLWARTIICEGPGCGAEVPLVRSLWLAKKKKYVALQIIPNPQAKRVGFKIIEDAKAGNVGEGTVRRGSATCPICNYTTPVVSVRRQLKKSRGGANNSRLLCVVTTRTGEQGRFYRLPTERDLMAVRRADAELERQKRKSDEGSSLVPDEPTPEGIGAGAGRAFSQRNYGMESFADLYTSRQLLTLATFAKIIRDIESSSIPKTLRILLALALGRVNDLSMTLCRWLTTIEAIAAANGGQNRMPVVLDFVEANPFGGSGGDWLGQIDWVARVVEHIFVSRVITGTTGRAPAQIPALPRDSADVMFTDPPYYDAFPYSDLSDFFFVWLKRALGPEILDYEGELVPKDEEIVVYDVVHGEDGEVKNRNFFQREMTKSFASWREVVKPSGIGIVVFANKTTQGWETLIQSIIDAGWTAIASWPIDTERPNRQRALGSAALGSSVHVVCHPREKPDGLVRMKDIGDWRDVLADLPKRIHEWMPRLATEGIVGADAIFACLGPALEIFSRYSRVEKASGEQVTLREYLEHVWAAVAKEALNMIFEGADATGFEEDARLTAMWLWTLSTKNNGNDKSKLSSDDEEPDDEDESEKAKKAIGGYTLEYDAARKIAQGLGAHLEKLTSVVDIKGDTARLLPVAERTRYLFGKDETDAPTTKRKKKEPQLKLGFMKEIEDIETREGWGAKSSPKAGSTVLDRLHQSMILFAAGRSEALKRFLVEEGAGNDQRFWGLAQALSALYPKSSDEKRWVDGVLARKKGLGF
jgi:putative DNA methylase